ncbi:hypothetical protein SCHPADRAFT_835294, partial [Schizopora paradoxa]
RRDLIIYRLLSAEGLPDGFRCFFCQKDSIAFYRCTTCIGRPVTCQGCCVESHTHNPFHQIERWTDGYFQKTSLSTLGYTIHMGHQGERCPELPGYHFTASFSRYAEEDLTFVDKSGVWTFNVSWCNCRMRPSKTDQLLDMGLYPATFRSPKTAFTIQLMDYFYFDLMECQTPAANFYNKLRRLTDNVEPKSVTDRYRELMVAARQWYDIKARIWAGVGHDPPYEASHGRLTLFCAPCPQPGINLPENWKESLEPSYIYRRQVNPDGNFGAPNMKTKRPDKEVFLNDGEGTFVARVPYKEHLDVTSDVKEKSTCSNLKAVSNANANRKDLECTGIGGCVCARHGCVIPHSMVDFQKGEQQKNMDYCICNALSFNSDGLPEAAVIYDLACQWGVHFQSRLERSSTLSIPRFEKLITAVGKFHLGSHIDKCFFRNSLNFVEGTGQVDGEIIETLWSGINPISAMARSMTKSHRQEVLDAATRDWNWKKLTGVEVQSLFDKWTKAVRGEKEAKAAFMELSSRLEEGTTRGWEEEEATALRKGGDALAIYGVKYEEAPTMAEVRLKLAETETSTGVESGATTWIVTGMNLQEAILRLKRTVTGLRGRGTVAEKTKVEEQRRKLQARINSFHSHAEAFYSTSPDNVPGDHGVVEVEDDDDPFVDEEEEEAECVVRPENAKLKLPSYVISSVSKPTPEMKKLAQHELKLREGQANDALRDLRVKLGYKALLFRDQVRKVKGYDNRTRAWDDVNKSQKKVDEYVAIYRMARTCMIQLGASKELLEVYKEMKEEDLDIPADLYNPNRTGQRNDKMSWFWLSPDQPVRGTEMDTWMTEFYRVNWLRAKARHARWDEEKVIVKSEMNNTIRWFEHRRETWQQRVDSAVANEKGGHAAYARRQVALSNRFLSKANTTFDPILNPPPEVQAGNPVM